MELWYTENHSKDVQFSMKVDRQLYSGKSHFQRIDVLAKSRRSQPFLVCA